MHLIKKLCEMIFEKQRFPGNFEVEEFFENFDKLHSNFEKMKI